MRRSSWKNKPLCSVPLEIAPLVHGLYRVRANSTIRSIPCAYFKSSMATMAKKKFRCQYGRTTIPNPSAQSQTIECLQSRTMDVFLDANHSKPSILINRYHLTKSFIQDVLHKFYRTSTNVWSFSFYGESAVYYQWAAKKDLLKLFDITEGYDRQLYHRLISIYFNRYYPQLVLNRTSFEDVLKHKIPQPSFINSSILYINANCDPPSGRGKFMQQLMKYIQVDAWGKCHRNRKAHEMPKEILDIHGQSWNSFHYTANWVDSKVALSKSYLFTIAIENTIAHDYVTEKLWQPLAAGSVPIYLGAPNIDQWIPCENCFIDLRKYSDPKDVADLVTKLASNFTLYMEYHQWRRKPIPASFQPFLDYYHRTRNYSLECLMCDLAHHRNSAERKSKIIDEISFSLK